MSVGRTDFPGGSATAMRESLHQKLFTLDESITVYPGHGLRPPSATRRSTTPMPDGRLYVLIRGMDMAYDAMVLLGLFMIGIRSS